MQAKSIRTPVVKPGDDLFKIVKENVTDLRDGDVLVIVTKVISISQNRLVEIDRSIPDQKQMLMERESDYYIDHNLSKFKLPVTIKYSRFGLKAGIDETNCPPKTYVLWPEDPQGFANDLWKFLRKEFKVQHVGVVIADTTSIPLRKGFVGGCVAYCGFEPSVHMRKVDLFAENKSSTINVAEATAVAGVLEMGEIDEQTPLCIVRDIHNIRFQDHVPSEEELKNYYLTLEEDVFYPALKDAPWKKGGE